MKSMEEIKTVVADEIIPPEPVDWDRGQVDIKSRGQNRIVSKEQKMNLHFERYY